MLTNIKHPLGVQNKGLDSSISQTLQATRGAREGFCRHRALGLGRGGGRVSRSSQGLGESGGGHSAGSGARPMIPDPDPPSSKERRWGGIAPTPHCVQILRASLPAWPLPEDTTGVGGTRQGPPAKASLAKAEPKAPTVGSGGERGPDSPARLAAAASRPVSCLHACPPARAGTVLSHLQHFYLLPIN